MKSHLFFLSIALFGAFSQVSDAQNNAKVSGSVDFSNKEIMIEGKVDEGVFTGNIVFLQEPLAFNGTIALNTSLRDYAVGTFLSYDYVFTGTMIDWLPTRGVLKKVTASSPLHTDGAELEMKSSNCSYTYRGNKYNIRLYPKSFLDIFNILEENVLGGTRQETYTKYLKNKRFDCDCSYDGPIRRKVSLYFSGTGKVARIWQNYLSAKDVDPNFVPRKKGRRLCPSCGGKGAIYDITGRFLHYCSMCAGSGVVDDSNQLASIIEDIQATGFTLAFYDSMYSINEKGEKVYAKDQHGENVFDYSISGNRIVINKEEYVLDTSTGCLIKGSDVYESSRISEREYGELPVNLGNSGASPESFKAVLRPIGFYNILSPTDKDFSNTLKKQEFATSVPSREPLTERSVVGKSSNTTSNRFSDLSKTDVKSMTDVKSLTLKGGKYTFERWFNSFRKYPQEARDRGIHGTVVVQFYVFEDGHLGDVSILKSADPILDQEVLRVLKTSPRWEPVIQNGQPTKTKFEYSTSFSL